MEASDRKAHTVAPSDDRTAAWSVQLVQAHDTLRHQLRQLRSDLGTTKVASDDLLTHCLSFCSVLTAHHIGEDRGMFNELLRARPDLESVIANLVHDHQMIAAILNSVHALSIEAMDATTDRAAMIGRELDGLAAIVESHFGYEERAISAALDSGVRDNGWTDQVFQFTDG